MSPFKLFTRSSAKLEKSQNEFWLNAVLYLEPSVDVKVICKASTPACRASCLTNSGMMIMSVQTNARIKRTNMYLNEREMFMAKLTNEIDNLVKQATKQGKQLALRLNGTSDLDWTEIYAMYPEVQFYEYTKRPDLIKKSKGLHNLHITFSRTERTKDSTVRRVIESGTNVAVVFDDKKEQPITFLGIKVVDGDKHDRRFEDTAGEIVALKLKGTTKSKAIARSTGFAV
jgi:hypothetical protein